MNIDYIAGFTDADGCFGLYKKHNTKTCKRGFTWNCYYGISNTRIEILEIIQHFLKKGKIVEAELKSWGKKIVHTLIFNHREQRELIKELIPFLWVKKSQARLLNEALRLIKNNRFTGFGRTKRIRKNDERLEEIYIQLKYLKHN